MNKYGLYKDGKRIGYAVMRESQTVLIHLDDGYKLNDILGCGLKAEGMVY